VSSDLLVAGVGNIFFRDDAFGVEVARRLTGRELPPGTEVADFGIRGVHLAYEVAGGYSSLILVDALDLGEPPGTLAVIDAGDEVGPASKVCLDSHWVLDGHSMSPAVVLSALSRLGARLERALVVGCQPACVDEGEGLSPPVEAAVQTAVELCLELAREAIGGLQKGRQKGAVQ
jgi:hydrogenase maturation protease